MLDAAADARRVRVPQGARDPCRACSARAFRPRGSRSAIERRTGQAPPNFLSELSEGITREQWRRIQRLPGVEVAAPIANVGYVLATARVPVDVSAAAGTHGRVLLRARIRWRSENGLTRA